MPFAVGIIGLVGTMVLQYVAFASMPVVEANLIAYTWPLMVAAAIIVLDGRAVRRCSASPPRSASSASRW